MWIALKFMLGRVFLIENFLQKQNCKFHKLTGLTRKQGYKKCPCNEKKYNKINNIIGQSNIWSFQISIFSINSCLDQSIDKIF